MATSLCPLDYALATLSLYAFRQRIPLPVFVVLLAIALVLTGFACACLSDHPLAALDRLALAVPAAPTPTLHPFLFGVLVGALVASAPAARRLTQADLQRFVF